MVINHLERLFVTKDASTIMSELEVQHPAAKLLVFAAKAQESEIGDGTNLVCINSLHACKAALNLMLCKQVLSLGGELLSNAEGLLQDGLHTSEIADGYMNASVKVTTYGFEILEEHDA